MNNSTKTAYANASITESSDADNKKRKNKMDNEHPPIPARAFQHSYPTKKPRWTDDSLAVGALVTAIIVLGLTILGLVVILWY